MFNAAYWISPKGEIIPVSGTAGSNHITVVTTKPELFGVTEEYLKGVYEKYDEPYRSEGRARGEIILDLVRKGWIRIRRYRNQHWSVNVHRETKKVKDYIFDWANKMTDPQGLFDQVEKDIYMDVKVFSVLDDRMETYTLKEILQGVMYESDESFNEDNVLIEKDLNAKPKWVNLVTS